MESIFEKIKFHQPGFIDMEHCGRASVCIPLISNGRGGYDVLFEVRASAIDSQPGDVCLPGGMQEGDEVPCRTAIRELKEELLLTDAQITLLGEADRLFAAGNLVLSSFPVLLADYQGTYSRDEVEEIFTVPLDFFIRTRPRVYTVESCVKPPRDFPYELIHDGRDYAWRSRREEIYFYQYENHVIWGLTAKLMRAFGKIFV